MNIDLKLKLGLEKEEIKWLKWFKTQHRPILRGYHPIVYHLEYMGVLLTTTLEENGRCSDKTYILPSGIGKEILKML